MPSPAPISSPALPPPSLRLARILGAILLGVLAISLIASVRQESQTFDEANHLYAGFMYWHHADFGRNPEHPPLAKLLAALPLLSMGLKEAPPAPIANFKVRDFNEGEGFLYRGDADAILLRGRLVIACFTLALGLLVFLAAQEMFGNLAALLALTLFVFEPTLLANGAIVTTDMPLACLFFASVYTFYRYVTKPVFLRLVLCAFVAGLALAAKHSGVLVLPTLFLLAIAGYFTAPASGDRRTLRLSQLALVLIFICVVSYAVVWAVYGFRFAARPGSLQITPLLTDYAAGMSSLVERYAILFCARHHLLPEAYLFGWVDVLLISTYRGSFVFGHMYPTGKWFFFPAVFLIKSTLALLVLLVLAPFARIRNHRRELLFLGIPVVFFFATAIASMLNIGVRHVLPIYPFCILLAGAVAASLAARNLPARIAVAALLVLTFASSLHAFPDYLAYSNEVAGGPSNTYNLVEGANDEWGQGLKWTKTYLDQHPSSQCWIDPYEPNVDPAYYGIPCRPLLSGFQYFVGLAPDSTPPSTLTGTILLATTDHVGLHFDPGELNPYQPLHDRKPDAVIGNIFLVYNGSFALPLLAADTDASAVTSLLRRHRNAEALARAQHGALLAPDSAYVIHALALALRANGRTAEADAAAARSIQLATTIYPEYQKALAK
jgi:Dolichyl-phosphate-mannose-protein mannosyltransferase